jgi:hypothetical protein
MPQYWLDMSREKTAPTLADMWTRLQTGKPPGVGQKESLGKFFVDVAKSAKTAQPHLTVPSLSALPSDETGSNISPT